MMNRGFTWFPLGGLGKPKLYQNMWCFTRIGDFTWRECVSYKYLHLTGLWLGMMDRNNATDRNVYSIPHPSSL